LSVAFQLLQVRVENVPRASIECRRHGNEDCNKHCNKDWSLDVSRNTRYIAIPQ